MTHEATEQSGQVAWYTASETAALLRVNVNTLYWQVQEYGWPHHRLGRRLFFTPEQIAEIRERTRQPHRPPPPTSTGRRRSRKGGSA